MRLLLRSERVEHVVRGFNTSTGLRIMASRNEGHRSSKPREDSSHPSQVCNRDYSRHVQYSIQSLHESCIVIPADCRAATHKVETNVTKVADLVQAQRMASTEKMQILHARSEESRLSVGVNSFDAKQKH